MAYATGSAASCSGVLQSLASFCTSYGWTVDRNAAYSGGWWLAVHKGSCYLNFSVPSGDGYMAVYGATGYNSSLTPSTQAGTSPGVVTDPGRFIDAGSNVHVNPGPYTAYHFFSSTAGTYLHVLVEISAGLFAHLHAGVLNTVGGAAPAIYTTGSFWYTYIPQSSGDGAPSSPDNFGNYKPFSQDMSYGITVGYDYSNMHLGCTVDSTFSWFKGSNGSSPTRLYPVSPTGFVTNGFLRSAHMRSPNTWNGLSVGVAIPFFAERASGNIYSFVGEAPDVRFFNMKNNNAKDEITIGSDVWKVFPIVSNSPTVNTPNAAASSFPYGMAFLKSA